MSIKQKTKTWEEKRENILNKNTSFAIKEAYKTARTNIMFSLATSPKKIIVVTSSMPSEGKSTTSINVALTFAETEKKVLLIDADLRKPTTHNLLDIPNIKGLSTILGGFCTVEESITKNVIYDNLDVMLSGAIPPNPAELLSSDTMGQLLETLQQAYDYIIIDTPPVNIVSDSQLMNNFVSGILFVVWEGLTKHTEIRKSFESIKLANGKVLGFLKICSPMKSSKRYYKYNNYYKYGYGNGSYGYGYGHTTPKSSQQGETNKND